MVKSYKVPPALVALSEVQRASTREVGAPLYLPAFEAELLARSWGPDKPEAFVLTEADGVSIGADEDDDFY